MSQMFAFSCENENFNGLTCCMLKNMHSVQLCCQMNCEIAKSCDTPIFLLSFIVGLSFLSFTEHIRKYLRNTVAPLKSRSPRSPPLWKVAQPLLWPFVNPCQSEGFRRYIVLLLLCILESQMEKSSFPVASHATVFQLSETSQPRLNWMSLGVKSIAKCTGAFLLDTSTISGHIQTIPTNVLILLLSAK